MKKQLKKIILNYIEEYYGKSEKEQPCYDIDLLAKYIEKEMNKNDR